MKISLNLSINRNYITFTLNNTHHVHNRDPSSGIRPQEEPHPQCLRRELLRAPIARFVPPTLTPLSLTPALSNKHSFPQVYGVTPMTSLGSSTTSTTGSTSPNC